MSVAAIGTLAGIGFGTVAVASTYVTVFSPKGKEWRRRRENDRIERDGRPARIVNGREIEPALPSLAEWRAVTTDSLASLTSAVEKIAEQTSQLVTNGGSTLADRLHAAVDKIEVVEKFARQNAQTTGNAAAAAATADQGVRELKEAVDDLSSTVGQLTSGLIEHLDEARRVEIQLRTTIQAIAQEVGYESDTIPRTRPYPPDSDETPDLD